MLPVKRIFVPAKHRLTLREINGEASVMRVLSVLPDDTPTLKIAIVAVPLAAAVEVGATLLEHGHDVRSGRWEAAGVEPSPAVGRTPLSAWQRRLGGRMADGRWIRYIGVVAAGRHRHAQVFADTRTEFVVGGAFFPAPRQFDAVVCHDVLYCVTGRNRCWAGHGRWSMAAAIS